MLPVKRRPSLPRALVERLPRRGSRPEEWFLGSLQTRVLATLSRRGPSTVREVADSLRDQYAYTTVMTVLGKLYEKGLVGREQRGKGYLYTSRYSPEELRDRMARYLVKELVDDFGDLALAHFATALDQVQRRRLAQLRRSSRG
jgi:predicted transcriptional regulator